MEASWGPSSAGKSAQPNCKRILVAREADSLARASAHRYARAPDSAVVIPSAAKDLSSFVSAEDATSKRGSSDANRPRDDTAEETRAMHRVGS
jgi:hypothetical protein